MKITYLDDFKQYSSKDKVLALGFFDGFHLGHKAVLDAAIKKGKELKKETEILTFSSSISSFIKKEKITYLTSLDDKIELAKKWGFDGITFIDLTEDFVNLKAADFYELFLKDQAHLVLGFDYTYGKDREGNALKLRGLSPNNVTVISELSESGHKIGTYEIKKMIETGDILGAERELNRPYAINGVVYKRNKKYAITSEDYVLPHNGVYEMIITSGRKKLTFTAKIKALLDGNGLLFKLSENDETSFASFLKKRSHLIFTKSTSIIL